MRITDCQSTNPDHFTTAEHDPEAQSTVEILTMMVGEADAVRKLLLIVWVTSETVDLVDSLVRSGTLTGPAPLHGLTFSTNPVASSKLAKA